MLIRNMPLRRGGMHAKEVSRIWLTSDHCESRFMPDDNAPTQKRGSDPARFYPLFCRRRVDLALAKNLWRR